MHNNFYIRNNYKNIIPFNLKKNKLRVHANIIGNKTTSLHGFYIRNEIKFWYYYFGINGLKKDNTILIKQFWNKKLSVFFISNFNMIEGKWGFSKIYEQYYENYLFIKNIKSKLFRTNLTLYNNYSNYLDFFNFNLNFNNNEDIIIKKIFKDDLLYRNRKEEVKLNNKNIWYLSSFFYKNILFYNIYNILNINNNFLEKNNNILFKLKKNYKLPVSYSYNFDNLQNFMKNIFSYEYNVYYYKKKKNIYSFYNNIYLNFLKNYKKFIWNFNLIKEKKNLNINKNKNIYIKKHILLKFITIKKIFNLMQFYKLLKIIKNNNKNNIISLFYKLLLFFKFIKFKFIKIKNNFFKFNNIKYLIKQWYNQYKLFNENKKIKKRELNKKKLDIYKKKMIIKLFINKLFINKYIKNLLILKKNLLRNYKKKLLINNKFLRKKKKNNLNYKLLNKFSLKNIKYKKFNKLNFFNNINININEMEYSNIFWWKFKKISILRKNNILLLQQKF